MICLIILLSSKSSQKAGGQNVLPHTKSDDNSPPKVLCFAKSLEKILAKCISSLQVERIKISVNGPSFDVIVRQVPFLMSFSINGDQVFFYLS